MSRNIIVVVGGGGGGGGLLAPFFFSLFDMQLFLRTVSIEIFIQALTPPSQKN